jgi:hypothetical protein
MTAPLFAGMRPARPRSAAPVCTLAIDLEEDFDWLHPVQGTSYSTVNLRNTNQLHGILGAWGIVPAYLVTYPVLEDAEAVRHLRRRAERGECVLGLQLHPWVTPPLEGAARIENSFSGNLPPALEEAKLLTLKRRFIERFGIAPRIFRAGRYGLGGQTARLLEQHGIEIDLSLAPRTEFTAEGGPDFTGWDCTPFWFGERRTLLELPLCRSIIGWGGGLARRAYQHLSAPALARLRLSSVLSRLRCAERVTLSPEGNDVRAMRRLLRHLRRRGQSVFALSFHSSSLGIGLNPYVQSQADLHLFYDRLSATLDDMAGRLGFTFRSILEVPALLAPPDDEAMGS